MKKLLQKLKTTPCAIVFLISLIIGFLLTYKILFVGYYTILGIVFILVFATTIACMTRSTKEKVIQAREYKKSFLGILGVVL
jgi:Ca2+-dependent lipid-binding protein